MRRLASTAVLAFALAMIAAAPAPGTSAVPRVVGGGKAYAAGWQFAVALEQKRRFICSGSLIAPTKVLTAAHCVKSGKRKQLSILTGNAWISKKRRPPRTKVSAVAVDPHYNGHKDRHDFAVLTLETPSPSQPIQLATLDESKQATQPGRIVRSGGWGTRSAFGVNVALRLKTTKERVYRARKCDRVYDKSVGFNNATQICALGKRILRYGRRSRPYRSTTCEGDSGGPIVANTVDGARLVGAVSGGVFPCGLGGASIYARISNQLGFILSAAGLE
jgi:secreted trypsin-like serine protease